MAKITLLLASTFLVTCFLKATLVLFCHSSSECRSVKCRL